ncbi:MAG TPA: solute-binding protein [Fastidiosipila sp.]|nr:solute-binding protein [Fastidiosipila sp.]
MKKKVVSVLLSLILLVSLLAACQVELPESPATVPAETTESSATETELPPTDAATEAPTEAPTSDANAKSIILSTTTSTEDSGLLNAILPDFTEKTGIEVKVVAVGTGAALKNGEEGNADVVLVHAKEAEEKFVEDGFGVERFDVMYNDFVLLGPESDPAGVKANSDKSTAAALARIAKAEETPFISRGDDSGTHKKELAIWQEAKVEPKGDWYVEAGQGMGAVLTMADEQQAYTLSDRATYLSRPELELEIVLEGDEALMNQYGVIAVNPEVSDQINAEGAAAFVEWILSPETQKMINEYGVEEFGQPLFFANAKDD